MIFQPAFGESFRQNSKKSLLRRSHVARLSRANRRGHLAFRSKVDSNRLSLLPVRRDLQYRRAAQTAMRDEHFFPERAMIALRDHFCGNARKVAVAAAI